MTTPAEPGWWGAPLRFINVGASHFGELGRWVLDAHGIDYVEERHAPVLHVFATRRAGGGADVPVVCAPDVTLADAAQLIAYFERLVPGSESLFPAAEPERAEASALLADLLQGIGPAVRLWAYSHMLPDRRGSVPVMGSGAPAWERMVLAATYPLIAAAMRRSLGIDPQSSAQALAQVRATFERLDGLLADGRRFLVGERCGIADVAFASLSAPGILPEGYGGVLPAFETLPPEYRAVVEELRGTRAGKHALRIYAEHRAPAAAPEPRLLPGAWERLRTRLTAALTGPRVLRAAFAILRRFMPVTRFGGRVLVARHADVVDVLRRDTEFTIAEVNNERMVRLQARFFLGWDRSPEYERETGILRQAVRREDLEEVRALVRRHAAELIDAARARRRIDFVGSYARRVATRTVAHYFGTPGPTEDVMMRWMRILFYELFFNRTDDARVRASAERAAAQLAAYLRRLIDERRIEAAARGAHRNDVLGRLLAMQEAGGEAFDDDGVRRNISGLIVGAVDTTAHAATHAIDQLLRRPEALRAATEAARNRDADTLRAAVYEALRFNPQTPALLRHCARPAVVGAGQRYETTVPAGTEVVPLTLAAMFDTAAFPAPTTMRFDRDPASYLHFGHGMHECFGRHINGVQIPAIVGAALLLPNLRRAAGAAGRIAYDGPFPDRLVLTFDA